MSPIFSLILPVILPLYLAIFFMPLSLGAFMVSTWMNAVRSSSHPFLKRFAMAGSVTGAAGAILVPAIVIGEHGNGVLIVITASFSYIIGGIMLFTPLFCMTHDSRRSLRITGIMLALATVVVMTFLPLRGYAPVSNVAGFVTVIVSIGVFIWLIRFTAGLDHPYRTGLVALLIGWAFIGAIGWIRFESMGNELNNFNGMERVIAERSLRAAWMNESPPHSFYKRVTDVQILGKHAVDGFQFPAFRVRIESYLWMGITLVNFTVHFTEKGEFIVDSHKTWWARFAPE